jgi:hypothetical protein
MRPSDQKLLRAVLQRLEAFESDSLERLSRVEENLRLLRQDLVGDGQPGRIQRLELEVGELRADSQRQRGIFIGISLVVSSVISLLSLFLCR